MIYMPVCASRYLKCIFLYDICPIVCHNICFYCLYPNHTIYVLLDAVLEYLINWRYIDVSHHTFT